MTGGTPQLTPATPRPNPWTPKPSPLTPQARTPFTEPDSSSTPHTWDGVCDWVLGGPFDLWQQMFETPFLRVSDHAGACCQHGTTVVELLECCSSDLL